MAFVAAGGALAFSWRSSATKRATDLGADGPAPGSRVVSVRVRAGAFVDRVEFVYSDGFVVHYGGDGGNEYAPFVLGEGEHVARVRGRCGACVDSIQVPVILEVVNAWANACALTAWPLAPSRFSSRRAAGA